jgi:hypothetical protein
MHGSLQGSSMDLHPLLVYLPFLVSLRVFAVREGLHIYTYGTCRDRRREDFVLSST